MDHTETLTSLRKPLVSNFLVDTIINNDSNILIYAVFHYYYAFIQINNLFTKRSNKEC